MFRFAKIAVLTLVFAGSVLADEVLYRYEGDVFPPASEGWITGLGSTCTPTIDGGFLVHSWPAAQGSYGGYLRYFGDDTNPPPSPPFWAEWRFASNNAIHGSFLGDGQFILGYKTAALHLSMYGDSIIWQEGGTFVLDLPLDEFRTFRFESPDGNQWCSWFDGKPFLCRTNGQSGTSFIIMAGSGGSPYATTNRWDYVRYGRLSTGETIIASDPPSGYLDPVAYSSLDRFTVTFDQPNYVYVADVAVEVVGQQTAGAAPVVIATRRQDNGAPETVEIVLDRPLTIGSTTRFTFNTGAAIPQVVEYTVAVDPHPIIPTTSSWGILILALSLLTAAKLYFPSRRSRLNVVSD